MKSYEIGTSTGTICKSSLINGGICMLQIIDNNTDVILTKTVNGFDDFSVGDIVNITYKIYNNEEAKTMSGGSIQFDIEKKNNKSLALRQNKSLMRINS